MLRPETIQHEDAALAEGDDDFLRTSFPQGSGCQFNFLKRSDRQPGELLKFLFIRDADFRAFQ